MIKSAVTISLVPEARGGPFVFWDDLEEGCRKAASLGFDGVEIFAPDAATLEQPTLKKLLDEHGLHLAAAGTGAGWLKHKLTLTSPDVSIRRRAIDFIRSIINAAAALGAPAIIGSMQGQREGDGSLKALYDALRELDEAARSANVQLLFEPLNRYETNLMNSVADAAPLLRVLHLSNTKVLADLFHMNIEEPDIALAIRRARAVGHVHFADSNRWAVGYGHTDMAPIVAALRDIGYDGYVSAEVLPRWSPDYAAQQTMESFRKFFR
jgi:sugar phosphate isomerase/epimerase